MTKIYTTIYCLFIYFILVACESKQPEGGLKFLNKNPQIDGQLDQDLDDLEENYFNHVWQFNNPVTDTVQMSYKMAYTATHLYVYIEANTDQLIYRRRGYINGDGFMLLLGLPQKDSLTNEYYDLYFSASEDKSYWAKEYIAGYNFKANFDRKFSDATLSAEKSLDGITGYEALIAWKDIQPYHPWFLDKMGYNLYFAKAIGDTITNGYAVVEDEGIWDEEIPRRNFTPLSFQKPETIKQSTLLLEPLRRNMEVGDKLVMKAVAMGPDPKDISLNMYLSQEEKDISFEKIVSHKIDQKFTQSLISWDVGELAVGKYRLLITESTDTLNNTELVVLPKIDFSSIEQQIQDNPHQLKIGTVNTLMFKVEQVKKALRELKEYERGDEILTSWQGVERDLDLFAKGIDPFDKIEGPYRRAFKSQFDGTYQPYTLNLPDNYDPQKRYPLLVYLHGSGQDEQGLLNKPRSNGKFIEIAPLGRDIFRAYSSDSSQKDIIEAMEDAIAHFSIDQNKIIIGGFSMGGYGALRTYFEHPELYKGVAVFAGHPDLANYWGVEGKHPNFLDTSTHKIFKQVPVFIYHGKKDGAIPVSLMEKLSHEFQASGVKVTERIVAEKGHEYPDTLTNNLYFQWLDRVIKD